ncbi:MAG: hypothetical protein H0U67_06120 [Gemmatimonadetes bacterium]|nr:hypothetical protein [Gemmatimonadota bacterium]
MNNPHLPDIVITTTEAATVTIRNPDLDPAVDPDAFQCRITQLVVGGSYQARFNDLPVGSRWVATAGNKKTCNHIIWPPLDPAFVPDLDLPDQQGAVYQEVSESSLPLTWPNWLQAAGDATELTEEVKNWSIYFQGRGRTANCTVFGGGQFVWAIQPGAGFGAPSSPNQPPPGLGLTYGKVVAGSCALAGLPENTSVILQTRNSDGGESTGFLCATCTSAALFPQLQLQGSTLIVDTEGDGTFVDLRTMTFGPVKRPSGELSDSFSILATFQGWNPRKAEAQMEFEIVLNPGTTTSQSIKVTAFYGVPKKGTSVGWYITGVQPDHQKNRVEIRSGNFDTTTRFGGLEILIRGWSGVTSAQIRVRANLAGGGMDAMPNNGFAAWPGDNGGSFTISF